MNYAVFRIHQSAEDHPFDQTSGLRVSLEGGAYVFRKSISDYIEVAYPVDHFWIVKED